MLDKSVQWRIEESGERNTLVSNNLEWFCCQCGKRLKANDFYLCKRNIKLSWCKACEWSREPCEYQYIEQREKKSPEHIHWCIHEIRLMEE